MGIWQSHRVGFMLHTRYTATSARICTLLHQMYQQTSKTDDLTANKAALLKLHYYYFTKSLYFIFVYVLIVAPLMASYFFHMGFLKVISFAMEYP